MRLSNVHGTHGKRKGDARCVRMWDTLCEVTLRGADGWARRGQAICESDGIGRGTEVRLGGRRVGARLDETWFLFEQIPKEQAFICASRDNAGRGGIGCERQDACSVT